ncbi:MAG TPA: hypothetical protein VGF48_09625 [Thermoanaerobaculia bacterium]|jgi:hypothetical protein
MSKDWLDNLFGAEDQERQKEASAKENRERSARILQEKWPALASRTRAEAEQLVARFNAGMQQRRGVNWKPLLFKTGGGDAFAVEREYPFTGVTVAFDASKYRVIVRHTLRETFDRELIAVIEAKGNYNTGDVDYWIVERNGEVFPHGKHQYLSSVAEFALQPVIQDAMKD